MSRKDGVLFVTELYDGAELLMLTGYSRAAAQVKWLRDRGIPHRCDGQRVLVSRHHVREWLQGRECVASDGPDWSALSAPLGAAKRANA